MPISCPKCSAEMAEGSSYCSECGTPTPTVLSREHPPAPAAPLPASGGAEAVEGRLAQGLGAKYQLKGLIGRGGFAWVYEVWDRELERRLAVKVLDPELAWTPGMLARFRQEAKALARLTHPAILPIHFVGEAEGLTWYAMPFVDGDSLAGLIKRRGAFTPHEAVALAKPVLEALGHAHASGLIHRDIKPDNVLVERDSGRVLLVDFGIAKILDAGKAGHKTATGFSVGTPHYMSPEQALGQGQLDARTDLYAFGATLYQMVTGAPPFDGASSQEIVGKHVLEPVRPPADVDARIPVWLSDVVVRCLAKKPEERFQSSGEVLRALEAGRRSGPTATVSAAGVAATVAGGETAAEGVKGRGWVVEEKAGGRGAGGAGTGEKTVPIKRRGPVWRGFAVLVGLFVLIAAAGAAAMWLLVIGRGRQLAVTNSLIEPAEVLVDGIPRDTVPESANSTLRLPRGPHQVSWRMIRPTLPDGTPLGVEVAGLVPTTERRPRQSRVSILAVASGQAMVAPVVSNPTERDLTALVNAGTGAEMRCNCVIPARGRRTHIGYYPLYQNTVIRFYDARLGYRGRYLEVPDVAGLADARSGVAVIEVRPPGGTVGRRR